MTESDLARPVFGAATLSLCGAAFLAVLAQRHERAARRHEADALATALRVAAGEFDDQVRAVVQTRVAERADELVSDASGEFVRREGESLHADIFRLGAEEALNDRLAEVERDLSRVRAKRDEWKHCAKRLDALNKEISDDVQTGEDLIGELRDQLDIAQRKGDAANQDSIERLVDLERTEGEAYEAGYQAGVASTAVATGDEESWDGPQWRAGWDAALRSHSCEPCSLDIAEHWDAGWNAAQTDAAERINASERRVRKLRRKLGKVRRQLASAERAVVAIFEAQPLQDLAEFAMSAEASQPEFRPAATGLDQRCLRCGGQIPATASIDDDADYSELVSRLLDTQKALTDRRQDMDGMLEDIARLRDERKSARREAKDLRRELLSAYEDHGNCEGWGRGHAEGWGEALAFHECFDGLTEEQELQLRGAWSRAQDGHKAWEEVKSLRQALAAAMAQLDSRDGRVVTP
jgi:hypothetical protein